MGIETEISWAHSTFNGWWGCERISEACRHCYAESTAKRYGLKVWGPEKTTGRRFFGDKHWNEPRKWNEKAAKSGEPWRVFCSSMADVFEDRRDLDPHRERLFKLIEETPALTWMLLTKRPECHDLVPLAWQTGSRCPSNVWLGTTAESQRELDRRLPHLARARWPALRFLSMEPLLEHTTIGLMGTTPKDWNVGYRGVYEVVRWVIVGGESGPSARPMNVEWARALRNECREVEVPFHFKQWGTFGPDGVRRSKEANGYEIDGQVYKAFPEAP